MIETPFLWIVPIAAVVSILIAFLLRKKVTDAEPGNEDMIRVQGYIKEGANAFIARQYKTLAIFVAGISIAIAIVYAVTASATSPPWFLMAIAYASGAIASAAAGWIGLQVGVHANSPTAWAAKKGLAAAFNVSFFGGAVMGLLVTGIGLIGVWLIYFLYGDPILVLGFSFGASSIALFMKAGGGIYTKTADVGADLVGKLEFKLPEDDSRNPAAVADNVGDNVGDIAGMGADLLDSYIASLVAAMLLCFSVTTGFTVLDSRQAFASYPLIISAAGLISSIVGILMVSKLVKDNPGNALNTGTLMAALLYAGISALFSFLLTVTAPAEITNRVWLNWLAGAFGVLAGLVIGFTTNYFTDDNQKPTQIAAEATQKGHAITILTGFSLGLLSILPTILGIILAMVVAWLCDTVWGIANAAVGMLAIVGTIVSNDAYGPITDNSRSLAEQGKLSEEAVAICDDLDSAGNTAKAVTKGFAIGAAALTVLALLYSFSDEAIDAINHVLGLAGQPAITGISLNLLDAGTMIGMLIGAVIPPVYSAILIRAVEKNAGRMVDEVRRQFTEHPGILEGKEKADYARCVDIATKGALQELIVPALMSIVAPLITGILFGVEALGAFLASAIATGFVFGVLFGNAGGTWDNAKKYVEDGHFGGKGSAAHAAAITGDTVGDPFKDTAGPSINTLICVMGLTASMFLVMFAAINFGNGLIAL
ncbi:MAG: sodium-translocating pyrophosphatase [Candidatus Lokiarchaeota archaeon]|nr:sodium-translocating pyrophosphatase [Candidatus Lokiarchaeota archaeon]